MEKLILHFSSTVSLSNSVHYKQLTSLWDVDGTNSKEITDICTLFILSGLASVVLHLVCAWCKVLLTKTRMCIPTMDCI